MIELERRGTDCSASFVGKGDKMASFRVGRVTQEILREVNDILSKARVYRNYNYQ